MLLRFLFEEEGQTLIEYGLLITLFALAIVTAITFFGQRISNHYNMISDQLPSN